MESTNASSQSGAAHDVLSNYELLENILLQLPMRDLLLSQRVNTQFKSVINRSEKLQKALFFLEDTVPEDGEVRCNSLVEQRFGIELYDLVLSPGFLELTRRLLRKRPPGSWMKMLPVSRKNDIIIVQWGFGGDCWLITENGKPKTMGDILTAAHATNEAYLRAGSRKGLPP